MCLATDVGDSLDVRKRHKASGSILMPVGITAKLIGAGCNFDLTTAVMNSALQLELPFCQMELYSKGKTRYRCHKLVELVSPTDEFISESSYQVVTVDRR